MPVIAIIGAIGADILAGAAIAETVGGIAAISATTAFEAIAAVGATLGAIGVVTGNKTLAMVGGAIGLVGGIGGIASASGLLGAGAASGAPIFGAAPAASTAEAAGGAAPAFGGVVSDASNAATYGSTAGSFGGDVAATGGMTVADAASANTIPFVADGLPAGQNDLTTLSSVVRDASDPTTLTNTATTTNVVDPNKALTDLTDPFKVGTKGLTSDASNPVTYYGDTPQTPFATGDATGATAPSTVAGTGMSEPKGSIFGDIFKWAGDHQQLASGIMTVGGKFLEGTFSSVTPAQVNALNAQAAANNAAAAMANQQRANLQMPKAVASSVPVTGTPAQIIPGAASSSGFINQAPRLAPVTGAPV